MIFPRRPTDLATPGDVHKLLRTVDTLSDNAISDASFAEDGDTSERFCFRIPQVVSPSLQDVLLDDRRVFTLAESTISWNLLVNRIHDKQGERLRESTSSYLAWVSLQRTVVKPEEYGGATYVDAIDYQIDREPRRAFEIHRNIARTVILSDEEHAIGSKIVNLHRAGLDVQPALERMRFTQEDTYEYCLRHMDAADITNPDFTSSEELVQHQEITDLTQLVQSLSVADQCEYQDYS